MTQNITPEFLTAAGQFSFSDSRAFGHSYFR